MAYERKLIKHDHKKRGNDYSDTMVKLYGNSDADGDIERLPLTITFQVTEDCNLACTYCYQHCKSKNRMTINVAKKAIDQILVNENYCHVSNRAGCVLDFIGGEPLLEIDLIEQIYIYFINKCIELNHPWLTRHRMAICSNGILFNTPKVQKFVKKYDANLSMSITIDGPKELHDACRIFPDGSGSHEIVAEAVKSLVGLRSALGTKVTIAPENLPYLHNCVKYLYEEFGFSEIFANCTFEGPWTKQEGKLFYYELLKIADYCYENDTYSKVSISLFSEDDFCQHDYASDDKNWCGGTGSMIAVDYQGMYYPCLRYMKSSLGDNAEPFVIGDIKRGIAASECDKCRCAELKAVTATSQSTEECINCSISRGCAWCSALNFELTGSVNKRYTEICVMHKARALANVYYWNRFYEKHNIPNVYENYLPAEDAISIIGEEEYKKLVDLIETQRKRIEVK